MLLRIKLVLSPKSAGFTATVISLLSSLSRIGRYANSLCRIYFSPWCSGYWGFGLDELKPQLKELANEPLIKTVRVTALSA